MHETIQRDDKYLVDFVPDEDLDDFVVDIRFELAIPPRERVEGFSIGNVVYYRNVRILRRAAM